MLSINIYSQEPGEDKKGFDPDTIVFKSPRPLITNHRSKENVSYALGGELALTESGFGAGFFYHRFYSDKLALFSQLYITGLRNEDEIERYIQREDGTWDWRVPGKENRLFRFPITFGAQYFPLKGHITESLQPYVSGGVGPNFILSTPYEQGWFEAFGDATLHTKFGGFVGIGAYFGNVMKSLIGVNIRYYYIPAGAEEIVSLEGIPFDNLGGLFLTLTVGKGF